MTLKNAEFNASSYLELISTRHVIYLKWRGFLINFDINFEMKRSKQVACLFKLKLFMHLNSYAVSTRYQKCNTICYFHLNIKNTSL